MAHYHTQHELRLAGNAARHGCNRWQHLHVQAQTKNATLATLLPRFVLFKRSMRKSIIKLIIKKT